MTARTWCTTMWLAVVVALLLMATQAHADDLVEHRIRYSITARNTSGELLRNVDVIAAGPVSRTGAQRTVSLQASSTFELQSDERGNQELRFRLTMAPYATKMITIDTVVEFATRPAAQRLKDEPSFLRAEPFVEVGHPAVSAAAEHVEGKSPSEVADALFRSVVGRVRTSGYVSEPHGALYALETGKGDCTEAMYLLVALARSRGIPARGVAGFVVSHDAVVHAIDYHNWAELYLDGAWRIADPDKRVFGTASSQYLAMRILGGTAEQLLGGAAVSASRPELAVRID